MRSKIYDEGGRGGRGCPGTFQSTENFLLWDADLLKPCGTRSMEMVPEAVRLVPTEDVLSSVFLPCLSSFGFPVMKLKQLHGLSLVLPMMLPETTSASTLSQI